MDPRVSAPYNQLSADPAGVSQCLVRGQFQLTQAGLILLGLHLYTLTNAVFGDQELGCWPPLGNFRVVACRPLITGEMEAEPTHLLLVSRCVATKGTVSDDVSSPLILDK